MPPSETRASSGHQNNVRIVPVGPNQQPTHIARVSDLQTSILTAAARLGLDLDDMPRLRGLCVQAVRSAGDRTR